MQRTEILQILGIFSGVMFVGSLLLVPWLITRLSEEFFVRHRQQVGQRRKRHPVLAIFLWLLRNGVGVVLLGAGLAMLVLPGQGVLTMVIGLSLLDFPGKQRVLEWCVGLERVRRSLNWIRRKAGKPEFVFKN